jgi:uridylate kinase
MGTWSLLDTVLLVIALSASAAAIVLFRRSRGAEGRRSPVSLSATPSVSQSESALRAAELSADAVLKATQVDGVYSADPKKDPNATRYETLTQQEAIEKNLGVMDTAAFALARENAIPIIVFSIAEPGAISQALEGTGRATLVTP